MLEYTTPTCSYCAIGSEQTAHLFNVECLQCAVALSLMFLYTKERPLTPVKTFCVRK